MNLFLKPHFATNLTRERLSGSPTTWMTWTIVLALADFLSLGLTTLASGTEGSRLAGTWNATVDIPGQPLDMTFQFTHDDAGLLTGSVDIPVQFAFGLGLAEIELDDDQVLYNRCLPNVR